MNVLVREERPQDLAAIGQVLDAAFQTPAEAALVDALRANAGLLLSLVAEADGVVVGHIAFSAVTVTREDGSLVMGIGLAPLAVLPAYQRSGVGTMLATEGLRRLREDRFSFCVVLGHPDYYPRFGFVPASRCGLRWEQPGHDEAFMVQELTPGGLAGVSGIVSYRPEFSAV